MSQLHRVLLGCGYQYAKAQHLPSDTLLKKLDNSAGFYVKQYNTVEGVFQVALSFPGDARIELPYAILLSYPAKLKGRLVPHVNFGHVLCYVQEMEADWDSNDIDSTYRAVDTQIQTTLDDAVNLIAQGASDAGALEGEFAAYWEAAETLYLLSAPEESSELKCRIAVRSTEAETANLPGSKGELVAFGDQENFEYENWLRQRNLEANPGVTFPVHFVRVSPSRLVGEEWPPTSGGSLLQWLTDVDPSARAKIAECIATHPVKRHVIVLDVAEQDLVGMFIELDLNALALAQYSSSRNPSKKKIKRAVKVGKLASSLSSARAVTQFRRLKVVRADRETILSRNRQRPEIGDLRNKRIALVGCGTVGGHVASLLLRAGAGCGSGTFDLFDDDIFSPGNFSRHPLHSSEIGLSKSVALAGRLSSSTHLARNISGKGSNFSVTAKEMKKYDLILDATGRPPIAKRMAAVAREAIGNRPILIHGFNDGNGRASKVLVDDGTSCYGCMISEPAFYKDGIDMRFKDIDLQREKRITCGSTYTPYDAAVSVVTAGMMQEAALNCLEEQPPWTYSEHFFDGTRSRRPRQILCQPNCAICNV